MLHEPLVILDFETTGLCPETGDRITEVGVVRIENGAVGACYESLVNCGVRVPGYITAYTGITQAMIDGAPDVRSVMSELIDFIGDTPVVAHGARFDHSFFLWECRRLGITSGHEPFICSMQLARRVHPTLQCHALGSLAHKLGLVTQGVAHRAPADAAVTTQLLLRLGRDLQERQPGIPVTAALLRELLHTPVDALMPRLERRRA